MVATTSEFWVRRALWASTARTREKPQTSDREITLLKALEHLLAHSARRTQNSDVVAYSIGRLLFGFLDSNDVIVTIDKRAVNNANSTLKIVDIDANNNVKLFGSLRDHANIDARMAQFAEQAARSARATRHVAADRGNKRKPIDDFDFVGLELAFNIGNNGIQALFHIAALHHHGKRVDARGNVLDAHAIALENRQSFANVANLARHMVRLHVNSDEIFLARNTL